MNTPIVDFVSEYEKKHGARMHMPGHKGIEFIGAEPHDITEICGADSLYEADGIIAESEKNAASLFGTARTVYSAEGSTQCIKAILYLAIAGRHNKSERPLIVAARNVHKAFVFAAAEIDFDICWMQDESIDYSLCRCDISPEMLEKTLSSQRIMPAAVYVTSPDYLGGMQDIKELAKVAHLYRVPLIVDNAHGAYLNFLPESRHPIALGADICCDSAHKTLPVLTGGAYLHFSKNSDKNYRENAKSAMALFGSTSPSYLILQSLDNANKYLSEKYGEKLFECIKNVEKLKSHLNENGWITEKSDPLKICVNAAKSGCDGVALAEKLRQNSVECEYADADFVILMITPQNSGKDFEFVKSAFGKNDRINTKTIPPLNFTLPESVLTVRNAVFSESEEIPVERAIGRIAALPTVSCPPAVPVVISGEKINAAAVKIMERYGLKTVRVVK